MRIVMLLVGFALVLAACGDSADSAAESDGATVTVAAPSETTATEAPDDPGSDAAVESTTSSAATAGPSFDGPPAPDFEMALSDGSTFSLSDEQKPVYLVFWAEW